ncbi:MAG: sugar kinase, partial [Spirochaetales bacterium]
EELSSITGKKRTEDVIKAALEFAPLVVMKSGAEGCVLGRGKEIIPIPAEKVTPLDTTGAGDSFAAAILYGLMLDFPLALCGRLANRIASRIVMVEGCDYSGIDREDVLSILREA